jgi:predicted outer membrane repeat protein
MMNRFLRAAAAAALALCACAASATVITVDSALDNGAGCTLRNAVATATDNTLHGTCAVGAVGLAPGTNTIQFNAALNGTPIVLGNTGPMNIDNNSLTIQGNGSGNTIVDAANIDRIFDNFGSGAAISITWQDMTIRNGNATAAGATGFTNAGAIYIDVNTTGTITNCVISGNHADSSGGAIQNTGVLSITNGTLDSNVAPGQGGAITSTGALTVINTTISNNSAGIGGGIWHSTGGQSFLVLNSTFAGNNGTTDGGAISADDNTSLGPVAIVQTTLANNTSASGGGIFVAQPGVSIDRSLIAQNTAGAGPDCFTAATSINSLGFNFLSSIAGCTLSGTTGNNTVNATPLLGALANNGGPTQTVAIQDESPVIDTGGPTCATGTDQRGVARPIGAACDPGAFEAPLPVTFTPTTLPPGQVGVAYSQPFTNGPVGTGPFTYAVIAGALPAGTSLTAAGTVQGTPTAAGPFSFTVRIFDSTGRHGSAPVSLTIIPPVIVPAPATLPPGTFGIAYSQNITASGGTAPYTFTLTSGATPTGVPLAASGLLAGTPTAAGTFNFTATATDSSTGVGAPFSASQAYSVTINAVLPGAPTIGTATAGDAQATVTFTAPGSNGGSAITTYTATSNPGNITHTGAGSPITVTGLTNGTTYTFTVTATNGVGTGPASGPSNAVTPLGAQTITFANPGPQTFGTSPTLTATSTSGLTVTFTSTTTGVCTITTGGTLTFIVPGLCTINADQAGNTSFAPAPTVPQSFVVNGVIPSAPIIGTATAGDTQATVTFTPPVSNGGSAITGYTATSSPGGLTASGAGSPLTVTGLTNGTAYTFTVTAANGNGTGPASAPSNSVTPKAAQTITFANPGAQTFGTSPTLTATASSALAVTFTSTTTGVCTITTGGTLTFVAAGPCSINADQAGNASFLAAPTVTQSFSVNAVVPGAPVIGAGAPGNGQATISFTPPASNGGAAITSYRATCNPGGFNATGAGSPITVTGLTNGTAYTCSVTATNSVGTGAASATVSVTPSAVVTTFSGPSATGTGTITASFSGGGPACTYTVSRYIPLTGDPASPPAGSAPSGVTFPQGLFLFTATGCTPGSAIIMTITYPSALPSGTQYWKYGPTSTDASPHWYVLPAAISGNTVTFSVGDGGLGDDDLAANGTIVDQGGPGVGGPIAGPPQVPTLSEWALLALMALLGMAGVFRLRGR